MAQQDLVQMIQKAHLEWILPVVEAQQELIQPMQLSQPE